MKRVIVASCLLACICPAMAGPDSFDRVKTDLSDAACIQLVFLSIVESELFSSVDTTAGSACLARDGRYSVEMGADTYLFDLHHLYSYSAENNQVVIEKVAPGQIGSYEVSYLGHLDELYHTKTIVPDKRFHLTRRKDVTGDIPDSIDVTIGEEPARLLSMEYFDINEELNRIVILKQNLDSLCTEEMLIPQFPDSVERIKL
ncbi:MAG: outer membrane lipoprotein carrier protein LolA [Candidatus Zixiibacteriota bacterium]